MTGWRSLLAVALPLMLCVQVGSEPAQAQSKEYLAQCSVAALKGHCIGFNSGMLENPAMDLSAADRDLLTRNLTALKDGVTSAEREQFSLDIDASTLQGEDAVYEMLEESGRAGVFDHYNKVCIESASEERKSWLAIFEFACTAP